MRARSLRLESDNEFYVGAGTYRMSSDVPSHLATLDYSIKKGCRIIDTAANYMGGKSEELVGKVIKMNRDKDIRIITKAGYVDNTEIENFKNIAYPINNGDFYYSIHPDFISNILNRSLKRMEVDSIYAFLIHNPEYLLSIMDVDLFYDKLQRCFRFLESMIDKGYISYYGISSNLLADYTDSRHINIERIVGLAKSVRKNTRFKIIQFPFNIYENKASDKYYMKKEYNLFEYAKSEGVKCFTNRPFLGSVNKKPIKIVIYEDEEPLPLDAFLKFKMELEKIVGTKSEELFQSEIFLFVEKSWTLFKSERLIKRFFDKNLSPLIEDYVKGNDLKHINFLIKEFHNACLMHLKSRISSRNIEIKKKLSEENEEISNNDSYASGLCKLYIKQGADVVLTGMRKPQYVDALQNVLNTRINL